MAETGDFKKVTGNIGDFHDVTDIGTFTSMSNFKQWAYTVLPIVYDDSLSYYEVLCKIYAYVQEFVKKLIELADAITELQVAVTALMKRVSSLETRMDTAEQAIRELQTAVTALQQAVAEIRTQITQMQSDIEALRNDVNNLNTEITNIDARITNLDNSIPESIVTDVEYTSAVGEESEDNVKIGELSVQTKGKDGVTSDSTVSVYAKKGGGIEAGDVTYDNLISGGTLIGNLNVKGTTTPIYAPSPTSYAINPLPYTKGGSGWEFSSYPNDNPVSPAVLKHSNVGIYGELSDISLVAVGYMLNGVFIRDNVYSSSLQNVTQTDEGMTVEFSNTFYHAPTTATYLYPTVSVYDNQGSTSWIPYKTKTVEVSNDGDTVAIEMDKSFCGIVYVDITYQREVTAFVSGSHVYYLKDSNRELLTFSDDGKTITYKNSGYSGRITLRVHVIGFNE